MATATKENMKTAIDTKTQIKNDKNYEKDNQVARLVDNVKVNITYTNNQDAEVDDAEIRQYIQRGNLRNPNTVVAGLDLVVDGEDVEITYDLAPVPFDRIRRITGYLVGTMDRWNDAKTSEENDRVKHSVTA